MDYFDHLERFLGSSGHVYQPTTAVGPPAYQLLRFDGAPSHEASTLATAGLAHHVFRQPSGHRIRQEIVVAASTAHVDRDLPATIDVVTREWLERHQPLLRGQVLGPRGPIVEGSRLEAFVCCSPWFWDDEFSVFDQTDPPTHLVLLLPIAADEAEFIRNRGIDAFEKLIEEAEPNLLSLDRSSALPG